MSASISVQKGREKLTTLAAYCDKWFFVRAHWTPLVVKWRNYIALNGFPCITELKTAPLREQCLALYLCLQQRRMHVSFLFHIFQRNLRLDPISAWLHMIHVWPSGFSISRSSVVYYASLSRHTTEVFNSREILFVGSWGEGFFRNSRVIVHYVQFMSRSRSKTCNVLQLFSSPKFTPFQQNSIGSLFVHWLKLCMCIV